MKKQTKKKNVDIVAEIVGGQVGSFNDKSCSWVVLENDKHVINICFDGKGDKFQEIMIAEKIYEVVNEKVIVRVKNK